MAITTTLALGWLGLWFLYLNYTWTANMSGGFGNMDVHVIRFYVPALGLIALLAASLLVRVPAFLTVGVIAALAYAGFLSYASMASAGALSGPGGQPNQLPNGHYTQPQHQVAPAGGAHKVGPNQSQPNGFHPGGPPGGPNDHDGPGGPNGQGGPDGPGGPGGPH
jgi:hypothetical protein